MKFYRSYFVYIFLFSTQLIIILTNRWSIRRRLKCLIHTIIWDNIGIFFVLLKKLTSTVHSIEMIKKKTPQKLLCLNEKPLPYVTFNMNVCIVFRHRKQKKTNFKGIIYMCMRKVLRIIFSKEAKGLLNMHLLALRLKFKMRTWQGFVDDEVSRGRWGKVNSIVTISSFFWWWWWK